ncbi:MAG: DUF2703 domain-containing protein [Armatimonadetes bacterium]|nr:DUF2703 domain-containing protein [Armatimonadota bacterium]
MVLTVNWQRLVTEGGETCDRCGTTQAEFRRAVLTLQESLRPLGINVEFTETVLTPEQFVGDAIASNRILIGERTVEEWLGGEAGQSPCESCCSAVGDDVQCRTVMVDGTTYEAVPAELIVRAGLAAASELLQKPTGSPCCPASGGAKQPAAPCCPGEKTDGGATG